jgi:hypothetical protein
MSAFPPKPPDEGVNTGASPFADRNGTEPPPEAAKIEEQAANNERGHGKKFVFLYAALGAIAALAIAGFVIADSHHTGVNASGWSSWKPTPGTTAAMTAQIADHVASQYHLNSKGTQLVAVVAEAPTVTSGTHKISISNIAIQGSNSSKNKGINVFTSGGTWMDNLCGLTPSCSIASGKATIQRGRLVRREALEVALYTFKFVPSINAVVAFMPPPPGATAPTTLLYLQRADLQKQLSEPLSKTLPLADPPLPTSSDKQEAATIDKLTLPAAYKFQYQQLQDASALLVLNPLKT